MLLRDQRGKLGNYKILIIGISIGLGVAGSVLYTGVPSLCVGLNSYQTYEAESIIFLKEHVQINKLNMLHIQSQINNSFQNLLPSITNRMSTTCIDFHRIGPWAASVQQLRCPCIYLSVPFPCLFLKASHWPPDHMIRSRSLIGQKKIYILFSFKSEPKKCFH